MKRFLSEEQMKDFYYLEKKKKSKKLYGRTEDEVGNTEGYWKIFWILLHIVSLMTNKIKLWQI